MSTPTDAGTPPTNATQAGTPPTSTPQAPWTIVAMREIMVKLRDKAFIIGTLATLAMMVVGLALGMVLSNRTETTTVVVTDQPAATLANATVSLADAESGGRQVIEVKQAGSKQEALDLVKSGDADVYLQKNTAGPGWLTTYKSGNNASFDALLTKVLQTQMMNDLANQTGTTLQDLQAQTSVVPESLQGDVSSGVVGTIAGIAFAILFMFSSTMYGMQIANSVVEEKQSRIVEILVSAIPVRHLLGGKVLGNTVMAFAQMALLLGVGLIGLNFTAFKAQLPPLGSAVLWFLVFFVAGFLALACVWAAAGAMCTRNDDLQQTSQPLMWVLMIAYFLGFAAKGTVRIVASYVPIVSSILMPARIVEGQARWWELLLALVLNLAFAAVTVLIGSRIYRRALLQTGGRLSYRQALALKE